VTGSIRAPSIGVRGYNDMSAALLQIRGLGVQQVSTGPRRTILDDISLDLAEGETLCVVGESGSGKTMTAMSVMGLLPSRELEITSGSIRLQGEELVRSPEHRLRQLRANQMAMVFQEPMSALNPVMTIGQQIDETLAAHTKSDRIERRRRMLDMLEQVELPNADRIAAAYPHQLSGGQRQRAMIAMAMILKPRLLIADEPTSALDVRIQKQILRLMRDLRDQHGMAMLFVTHDMGVVAEIADRVAVMHQGRIVETEPLDRILRAPQHGQTRKLLAAVPALTPRKPRAEVSSVVALAATSLSKTYPDISWFRRRPAAPAVIDVDLTVRQGQTLGIVGESGSGKSTLARCLLRLIEPSRGDIRLGTADITALSHKAMTPLRRDIQIVVQDPYRALNPRLTIADIIAEGPLNYGVSPIDAKRDAGELLTMVGLSPTYLQAYPHQLSGGQRQRVALARALALKPRVLVADEAVSALDMSTQAEILKLLDDLQARLGLAIVFVTHDLRVAAQICDNVAIMQGGRIVESGAASDILIRPRHAYTQALIDAVPGRHWDFAASRPADATAP
jgi:peptide/nickel transport system ATP-binding protein